MDAIERKLTAIVDTGYHLHRNLGPGLLESVYEMVLAAQLAQRGLHIERQLPIDFEYEGLRFPQAFRIDILVDQEIVLEIKSVERLAPVRAKQLLTYLRLTGLKRGLLINFGGALFKGNVERILND